MSRFHFITIGLPLMTLVACFQAQAAEPFRKEIGIEGAHFLVEANDPASPRQLKITASGLKEALRGFDFERAKTVLQIAGVMPRREAGGRRSESIRVAGDKVRVYAIQQWVLYPEGESS